MMGLEIKKTLCIQVIDRDFNEFFLIQLYFPTYSIKNIILSKFTYIKYQCFTIYSIGLMYCLNVSETTRDTIFVKLDKSCQIRSLI